MTLFTSQPWAARYIGLLAAVVMGLAFAGRGVAAPALQPGRGDGGLAAAVTAALAQQWDDAGVAYPYALDTIRQQGEYGVAYVYRVRRPDAAPLPGGGAALLARRDDGGAWQILFPQDPSYPAQLAAVPPDLLDPQARQMLFDATVASSGANAVGGYRLPWPGGQEGRVAQNYSQHGTGQIDFWAPSRDVVAAKAGEIVYINDGHSLRGCSLDFARYNNVVVVRHGPDEVSLYVHLAQYSVPGWIKAAYAQQGSVPVTPGTLIGRQGNTGFTCGGDGVHLHLSTAAGFNVLNYPDSMDEDGDGDRSETVQTAWGVAHQPVDFAEATYEQLVAWSWETPLISQNYDQSCAANSFDGVVLYDGVGCHGASLAFDAETRLADLSALGWNDRAQALYVAAGWSARLFEHVGGEGASRCIDWTVPDLAALSFDGGAISLNRTVSSLAVYQRTGCQPALAKIHGEVAPAALTLAGGARQPVTYTLVTTGSVKIHLNQRVTWLAPTGVTPLAASDPAMDFADVTLGASGATLWRDIVDLPAAWVIPAWQSGATTAQLFTRFTGADEVGRAVAVTTTLPVDLALCGLGDEWNDGPQQATILALDRAAHSGAICPAGDLDLYRFEGVAGQEIWAAADAAGGSLDPILTLLAGDGVTALATADDGLDTLAAQVTATLPITGSYYLKVGSYRPLAGGAAFTYTLQLQGTPITLSSCLPRADAYEPDNNPEQARLIPSDGAEEEHTLPAADDQDWVALRARQGVTYTLELAGKVAGLRLALYDQDGQNELAAASYDPAVPASGRLVWSPAADGLYYAAVTSAGASGCRAVYWLAVRAADDEPPVATLAIESGAAFTNRRAVTLTVSAQDPGAGIDAVLLGQTSAFADATWAEYQPLWPWQLPAGDGPKRLYLRVRDLAGNLSAVVTATIELDTVPPVASFGGGTQPWTTVRAEAALPVTLDADATHVRLRVGEDPWPVWQPAAEMVTVTLPARYGRHLVELQARDGAGNLSLVAQTVVEYLAPAAYLPLIAR